jgi:hypothetical protein
MELVHCVQCVHLRIVFGPDGGSPETHTKRQVTQHGCQPSLLGGGDKGIEKAYGEEKIFVLG